MNARGWMAVVSAATCLLLTTRTGHAHMMPARNGTVNLVDNAAFAVLSLPATALPGFDDDGDGRLSAAELGAHERGVSERLRSGVRLTDGATAGRIDFLQVTAAHDEHGAVAVTTGSDHVLVLMKVSFDTVPSDLRLAVEVWGPAADETLTIKAARKRRIERAVLTPTHREHGFFAARLQPWLAPGLTRLGLGRPFASTPTR